MTFFSRLKDGLAKTRSQIATVIGVNREFNDQFYESLEEALIAADIGLECSTEIIAKLKKEILRHGFATAAEAYAAVKAIVAAEFAALQPAAPAADGAKPHVVLVVGVNGVGKTTTIGKLAHLYRQKNKKVMLAAADTFRAGAIEQLRIWAERTGSEFVAQHEGADAASIGYDALEAAAGRGMDVLIIDTAGRLHTKTNLMNELEKIVRVLRRRVPEAPHEVLLVIDATTGQNALSQARVFAAVAGCTGLVITKLDGTAKGGIAVALARELKLPIRKIGVGEGLEDLQDFNPADYAEAMFGELK